MNLQEFAALKAGDRIENAMSNSRGEVTEVTANGVRVSWGPHGDNVHGFLYSVQGTAWMHWSKVESNVSPELDKAISAELADKPPSIMGKA